MASTTLITGATGFAGRHLLAALSERTPVVAWHRPGGTPPDQAFTEVEWRPVDLLNRRSVVDALAEQAPSRIYHLAGAPQVDTSWRNTVPHLQTNALGTYHLLEAIRESELPCRVLVASSAQVYQISDDPLDEDTALIPPSPYGLSKLAQDQLALRAADEDGLDVVVGRAFNHTGPGQRPAFVVPSFARQIARIEAGLDPPRLIVGNLDTRRDITDVRDVVEAYELLMEGGPAGRPYNICSGRAWRIGDLLEELRHLSAVPVTVEIDPARLRPNDTPVIQGDATRIRAELGWHPRIPVEQTLRDTLHWWRQKILP